MIPITPVLQRRLAAASSSIAALVFSLIFTSSAATFAAAQHHVRLRPVNRLRADVVLESAPPVHAAKNAINNFTIQSHAAACRMVAELPKAPRKN
jgi:hypothetical protein